MTSSLCRLLEIQGCSFSSKEETGGIKSQYWPKNYRSHSECMWNIAVRTGKKITQKLTHFDLEARDMLASRCYDNVMLYDNKGTVGHFLHPDICIRVIKHNYLLVIFISLLCVY